MIRFITPLDVVALVSGFLLFAYAMDWYERLRK